MKRFSPLVFALLLSCLLLSPAYCEDANGLTPEVTLILNEVDRALTLLDQKFAEQEARYDRLAKMSSEQAELLDKSKQNLTLAQTKLEAAEKLLLDSASELEKQSKVDRDRAIVRRIQFAVCLAGGVTVICGAAMQNIGVQAAGVAVSIIAPATALVWSW